MVAIDYSLNIISSYAKKKSYLTSNSLVPSQSPYLSPSAIPSEKPTFNPNSVCDILSITTFEEVENGSDCINRMIREVKYDFLKDSKYLLSVVNTKSTDLINKERYKNMMSEVLQISEMFQHQIQAIV